MMYALSFLTGFVAVWYIDGLPNTRRHTLRYDFRNDRFVELNWTWPCR